MASMFDVGNQTNGQQLLLGLYTKRDSFKEGTSDWVCVQQAINKIIAQNFLEYINR